MARSPCLPGRPRARRRRAAVRRKLDRRSPSLSHDRSRSPCSSLQDYLNASDTSLWGLVTNGTVLRLMRDNASLTRPAYIEADLAQIFANEDTASFAVLWLLIHRTRFGVAGAPRPIARSNAGARPAPREGEAARDRLADQVEQALRVLGSGFLDANPDLRRTCLADEVNLTDWFNELLRLVYRLIFLMVAEDRNLLHPRAPDPTPASSMPKATASPLCVAGRAPRRLGQAPRPLRRHQDRLPRAWPTASRARAAGPWRPVRDGQLPTLSEARLPNRAFMAALYRLSWLVDDKAMVPVNWRAMETEELGSVYECLLELQPQLGDDGKSSHLRLGSRRAEGQPAQDHRLLLHARQPRSGAARYRARSRARPDRGRGRRSGRWRC